jgi:hypothetical protein
VDHHDPVGIDGRVRGQDVVAHAVRHGDHGVGRLEGGALAEARQLVAAGELLPLPGPQRLEAVGGDHVGNVVHELGEVTGEVRVPRVAVDEVGAGHPVDHEQVLRQGAQRLQLRPVAGQRLPRLVGAGHQGVVPGCAEAVDLEVDRMAASARASSATCTPAPPYTSGGTPW